MYKLQEIFREAPDASGYVSEMRTLMSRMIEALNADAIAAVIEAIDRASKQGRTVYTIGNGGSAAVASHFVNDMGVNALVDDHPPTRVVCLADNVASVTAVANDVDFLDVFVRQLRTNMQRGDLLLAMSVSGNSENVIRAVRYANEHGGETVGLCGFKGGRLAEIAQHVVHIPSSADEYGPVEDAFSIICHCVSAYLTMARGRFLHH